MPSAPCLFKKTDVKRAVAAAKEAGLKVFGVKFGQAGDFTVLTDAKDALVEEEDCNEWDDVGESE